MVSSLRYEVFVPGRRCGASPHVGIFRAFSPLCFHLADLGLAPQADILRAVGALKQTYIVIKYGANSTSEAVPLTKQYAANFRPGPLYTLLRRRTLPCFNPFCSYSVLLTFATLLS